MKRAQWVFVLLTMVAGSVAAKDLSTRLGVGYRNSYAFDLPSLAAHYYPNANYGVIGAVGVDSEDQASRFALSVGLRSIVFQEENLNFFTSGVLSTVSRETNGSTDSGFEFAALLGVEFFLPGLENLGFNVESGVSVSNVKKIRFRTVGDSFLNAGIIFYF